MPNTLNMLTWYQFPLLKSFPRTAVIDLPSITSRKSSAAARKKNTPNMNVLLLHKHTPKKSLSKVLLISGY